MQIIFAFTQAGTTGVVTVITFFSGSVGVNYTAVTPNTTDENRVILTFIALVTNDTLTGTSNLTIDANSVVVGTSKFGI